MKGKRSKSPGEEWGWRGVSFGMERFAHVEKEDLGWAVGMVVEVD